MMEIDFSHISHGHEFLSGKVKRTTTIPHCQRAVMSTLNGAYVNLILTVAHIRISAALLESLDYPTPGIQKQLYNWQLLLILIILHDLDILQYHNSQGIRYLGSCFLVSATGESCQVDAGNPLIP